MLTEDDKFAILRDANVGSVMLFDTVERILASRDARLAEVEALADEWESATGVTLKHTYGRALRAALHPDPSEAGA